MIHQVSPTNESQTITFYYNDATFSQENYPWDEKTVEEITDAFSREEVFVLFSKDMRQRLAVNVKACISVVFERGVEGQGGSVKSSPDICLEFKAPRKPIWMKLLPKELDLARARILSGIMNNHIIRIGNDNQTIVFRADNLLRAKL